MLTLFTAAAVLAACACLRQLLNRPERKDAFFWGGRIRLTALWNDGAAFSLPLKRKLVTALSILILPLVWVFRRRSPIGAGLALGGGLSNLWERLRRGAVYDYVQFPKLPHWASAPAGLTGPWRPLSCRRARLCWRSGVWAKTGRASATAF